MPRASTFPDGTIPEGVTGKDASRAPADLGQLAGPGTGTYREDPRSRLIFATPTLYLTLRSVRYYPSV